MTLKQQVNENAVLRNRLATAYAKQPAVRHVFIPDGRECETEVVDTVQAFHVMVEDAKDRNILTLQQRVTELESLMESNQGVMDGMIAREREALHNIQSTPIRRVYPVVHQSPVYPPPQMRRICNNNNNNNNLKYKSIKNLFTM